MAINNSVNSYQNLLSMLGQQTSASTSSLTETETDSETKTSKASSQYAVQEGEKVSVSVRAEKLSRISSEFFSGTIRSDQIPDLTQRLYEEGFLSEQEFRTLGGKTQNVSAITEASNFLNRFILDEAVDGDSEAAKSLLNVVSVIEGMDDSATVEKRRAETEAYEYISDYTALLQEAGAPADIIDGFENVKDVLSALNKVRTSEQTTGALSSYASVQEAYNELFKDDA